VLTLGFVRARSLSVLVLAILALGPGSVEAPAAAVAAEGEPEFTASVARIGADLRERMTGSSWHEGCPVGFSDLRVITLRRIGMDGDAHRGRLVVHRDQATRIVRVMRRLFEVRFPIQRMWLIDRYGGSDARSMSRNNTSAFNCRYVSGTTRWSQHAYGRAIDVNPIHNPYVSGSHVSPEAGERYADRSLTEPGMIHRGDAVVRAFRANDWKWGGNWSGAKDYQHFSRTGG
jgi:hypothetical protein